MFGESAQVGCLMMSFFQCIIMFARCALACCLFSATAWGAVLVPYGSSWRYLDDGSDQGTAWRELAFDASGWSSGVGQLGYGDGDEATTLEGGRVTYYFRHEFELEPTASVVGASLDILYDDSAIVYLNGIEVHRTSLLPATGEVAYNQTALSYSSDNEVDADVLLDAQLFQLGTNVVAVEVHNNHPSSSDASFELRIEAELDRSTAHTRTYLQGAAVEIDGQAIGPIYTGQADAELRQAVPDMNYNDGSGDHVLSVDSSDGGGANHIVLRFDDLIGAEDWQLPAGAMVEAASLRLEIVNAGSPFSLYRLAESVFWDETSVTWNNFGANGGGVELPVDLVGVGEIVDGQLGSRDIDVTDIVAAWVARDVNRGLALLPQGNDGVDILSGESETLSMRPSLYVRYTTDGSEDALEPDPAAVEQLRLVWVDDPATTVTVGWTHSGGSDAQVRYGPADFGRDADAYPFTHTVDRTAIYGDGATIVSKFARLSGLLPDTSYYFVLEDASGVSERYWFRTAPDSPQPFSFIAGGDSRNNRLPRQRANRMVAKLRPLFVAFTGDMIDSDVEGEWEEWLDDWQETVSEDGRMYPILPHRGNHESRGDSTIYNLFDTTPGNYYGISFGGDLLRYYVLNSHNAESAQATWLDADLVAQGGAAAFTHLLAGYHKPMRPHQSGKVEGSTEYEAWAQLFYDNGFDLVFESDSHVMKRTLPLAPSIADGHEEGFIVDSVNGTVYAGEGCWGAPLRAADDTKSWTLAAGSFNGFDLVHVYREHIELYTVMVDGESSMEAFAGEQPALSLPPGVPLWDAAGGQRLVVGYDGADPLSFGQFQLDTFPGSSLPLKSGLEQDYDGDGLGNGLEFAFALDPTVADSATAVGRLPRMELTEEGTFRVAFRRRTGVAGRYLMLATQSLASWMPLEEESDYTIHSTPGDGFEDVEIEFYGPVAAWTSGFFRVTYGQ